MTNVVPLNSQTHCQLRVQAGAAVRHGDNQRFVPVVVGEFALLAVHYPILLTKDTETGAFFCGAMLGIDEGENLFLDEGGGQDAYRPLNLQRGCFYTAGDDLAVDLDHPRIDAGGTALFTDSGAPTPYLESIMILMRDLRTGMEQTRKFVETLLSLKLLEPVDIDLTFDDGTSRGLRDLYTVNQDALRKLPDATAIDLFRRGHLQLIYLIAASLKQIPVLARRKNRRLLDGSEKLGGLAR